MDSTEAFNVSVIENFSFCCLGSVYLNTSPAADVCFAFLPAKPAGFWFLETLLHHNLIYPQLSLCISAGIFTLFSAVVKWTHQTLYFSPETAHSCLWEALKCVCSQQLLMCHSQLFSFFRRGYALMSICCQQTQELFQSRNLNKTAPKTDSRGWESSLHLGLLCLCCLWGEGLCSAGETILPFKMWNVQVLGCWAFRVTWENLFLITVCQILSAGEPRSACYFKDHETINVPVSNSDL